MIGKQTKETTRYWECRYLNRQRRDVVMDFGFTNDESRMKSAVEWREAAIADGWSAKATYANESIERACKLERDGFSIQILTRISCPRWKYEVSIHIWGPDGLCIKPPDKYNWKEIQSAAKSCNYCNAVGVATYRVGFAGRCCESCMPEVRKKIERPSWDL